MNRKSNNNINNNNRPRRRRRNRRRRRGNARFNASQGTRALASRPSQVVDFQPFVAGGRGMGQLQQQRSKPQLKLATTQSGLGFLRAAFAAPDFNDTGVLGVPDKYEGKTIGVSLMSTGSFTVGGEASPSNYPVGAHIVCLPCMGTGAWIASAAAANPSEAVPNNTGWVPLAVNYLPFGTDDVSRFRYIGMACEIIPVTAPINVSGTIHVWRTEQGQTTNVDRVPSAESGATVSVALPYPPLSFEQRSGDQAIIQYTNQLKYVGPAVKGAYTMSTAIDPNWPFTDVVNIVANYNGPQDGTRFPDDATNYLDLGNIAAHTTSNLYFGSANCDIIHLYVSAPTIPTQPVEYLVKTWHTFEVQLNTNSPIYPFIKPSPPYDELALQAYKIMSKNLPIAVTFENNAAFWQTLLDIVLKGSRAISYIPGPIGMVGGGVNMLTQGIAGMFV